MTGADIGRGISVKLSVWQLKQFSILMNRQRYLPEQ